MTRMTPGLTSDLIASGVRAIVVRTALDWPSGALTVVDLETAQGDHLRTVGHCLETAVSEAVDQWRAS